jgi:ubiquinone/menaquinone biosynthesis C-methylase UbiE
MPNFSRRSSANEIMDDFELSADELHPVLKELDIINRLLGGFNLYYDAFNQLDIQNASIISDWGCGGGDAFKMLQKHFDKKNIQPQFIGLDATPATVTYAQNQFKSDKNVRIILSDVLKEEFKDEAFDYVISSLFTHHFDNEEWPKLIKKMMLASKKAVIINDLHRHPIAYYSIAALTTFFSKSAMVKNDSKISVLRGFTRKELKFLLDKAGATLYSIKWIWAFRWQIIIYK